MWRVRISSPAQSVDLDRVRRRYGLEGQTVDGSGGDSVERDQTHASRARKWLLSFGSSLRVDDRLQGTLPGADRQARLILPPEQLVHPLGRGPTQCWTDVAVCIERQADPVSYTH